MGTLTREQILSAQDAQVIEIDAPEWSVNGESKVYIRRLSLRAFLQMQNSAMQARQTGRPNAEHFALICALGICDETGAPVFSVPDDIDVLCMKPYGIMTRMVRQILEHNDLTRNDEQELEKNSSPTLTDDSHSD